MRQDDYKVELEVFEGPLDLLLYLIKRDEVDIYDIPIERITTQYMEYLNVMRMLDLNIAGEFIVMAATLMMIKSRMLLPVEERPEAEQEEEGEDPRWELVRQLVEYKKFKDAAAHLQDRALYQENVFGIGGQAADLAVEDAGVQIHDVSLFDLLTAFNEVLKRAPPERFGTIEGDRFTVAEKLDHILRVLKQRESVTFVSLFRDMPSRNELICTFLALLELVRLRQICARQADRFGEIVIERVPEDASASEEPGDRLAEVGDAAPAAAGAEPVWADDGEEEEPVAALDGQDG